LLTLSYAAIGYFQYLFFYWMHHYFVRVLLLGEMQSRFFAGLTIFAMAITMPLGGWLSARLEAKRGWRAGRVWVAGWACGGGCLSSRRSFRASLSVDGPSLSLSRWRHSA
jgi:MFS family permease